MPLSVEPRRTPEAEWTTARRDDGPRIAAPEAGTEPDTVPLRTFREDQAPTATAHIRSTPARLTLLQDAPRLSSPPSTVRFTGAPLIESPLAISRLVFCHEVRDYDDIVELAPDELVAGQTVLLFAALDNFRSQGQTGSYLTRTRSTIEILARSSGAVVHRLAPAEASDVAREPRHEFYLTHEIVIPPALPPGDYTLHLQIDDLLSGQRSDAQLPFHLQGGS